MGLADSTYALRLLPTPTARDWKDGSPVGGVPTNGLLGRTVWYMQSDYGPFTEAVARQEETFGLPVPEPTEVGPSGARRLSPKLPEWMMGLPDGYLTNVPGVTRNGAIKMAGNGVCPQQAEAALRLMLQAEHNQEIE